MSLWDVTHPPFSSEHITGEWVRPTIMAPACNVVLDVEGSVSQLNDFADPGMWDSSLLGPRVSMLTVTAQEMRRSVLDAHDEIVSLFSNEDLIPLVEAVQAVPRIESTIAGLRRNIAQALGGLQDQVVAKVETLRVSQMVATGAVTSTGYLRAIGPMGEAAPFWPGQGLRILVDDIGKMRVRLSEVQADAMATVSYVTVHGADSSGKITCLFASLEPTGVCPRSLAVKDDPSALWLTVDLGETLTSILVRKMRATQTEPVWLQHLFQQRMQVLDGQLADALSSGLEALTAIYSSSELEVRN